jgi:hypothetical protein
MRLRHAAALALIAVCACSKQSKGWYLMTPPIEGATVNKSAPLAKWEVKQSFDSANSCETNLDANKDLAEKAWLHPETQQEPKDWKFLPPEGWTAWVKANSTQFQHAVCIASDDPRLNAK